MLNIAILIPTTTKNTKFKKLDDSGLLPCYFINNKKGYKVTEIMEWIANHLTNKYDGINIISNFTL